MPVFADMTLAYENDLERAYRDHDSAPKQSVPGIFRIIFVFTIKKDGPLVARNVQLAKT
jgi:hypothetical protein